MDFDTGTTGFMGSTAKDVNGSFMTYEFSLKFIVLLGGIFISEIFLIGETSISSVMCTTFYRVSDGAGTFSTLGCLCC